MSWAIGYDKKWQRDIGYGVPAICDFPGCGENIDRGLGHVCGGAPYGGEHGCGLYFCGRHQGCGRRQLCERCQKHESPFLPTPDAPEWIKHKLTDSTWQEWRDANPEFVQAHLQAV
jgi:hypothetical protein